MPRRLIRAVSARRVTIAAPIAPPAAISAAATLNAERNETPTARNSERNRTPTTLQSGDAPMVRIAISQAAFDAIAATMALGSVGYENKTDEHGNRLVLLDRAIVDRLRSLRGPGESYSDVIIRVARGVGLFFPDYEPAGTGRSPDDDGLLRAAAYDGKVENRRRRVGNAIEIARHPIRR
jgi:hypothetical protein